MSANINHVYATVITKAGYPQKIAERSEAMAGGRGFSACWKTCFG